MANTEEILALETLRCAAMIRADVAALADMFADDMAWIHGSAKVDGKAGVLHTIASGKTRYLEINRSEQTVRLYGPVALVGGIADMTLEIGGETRTLKNRFTIGWLNDGGGWKVVNWQSTPIRAPA